MRVIQLQLAQSPNPKSKGKVNANKIPESIAKRGSRISDRHNTIRTVSAIADATLFTE